MPCGHDKHSIWMHAPNLGQVTALEGASIEKRLDDLKTQTVAIKRQINALSKRSGVTGYSYDALHEHGFLYEDKEDKS